MKAEMPLRSHWRKSRTFYVILGSLLLAGSVMAVTLRVLPRPLVALFPLLGVGLLVLSVVVARWLTPRRTAPSPPVPGQRMGPTATILWGLLVVFLGVFAASPLTLWFGTGAVIDAVLSNDCSDVAPVSRPQIETYLRKNIPLGLDVGTVIHRLHENDLPRTTGKKDGTESNEYGWTGSESMQPIETLDANLKARGYSGYIMAILPSTSCGRPGGPLDTDVFFCFNKRHKLVGYVIRSGVTEDGPFI